MRLYQLIEESAMQALSMQLPNGAMPPGHNGPYNDPETPVRNTSHWLISMLKAFEITQGLKFKDGAYQAAEFLLSDDARPMKAAFFCRKNPHKDLCNGLIGQAWTIEALVTAGHKLADQKYLQLAEEIFLMHQFEEEVGLWHRLNVDGSYASIDMTFNHQLWFAAAGALIHNMPDSTIGRQIKCFLDKALKQTLCTAGSGRIMHIIPPFSKLENLARSTVNLIRRPVWILKHHTSMVKKEIGYHSFNLYAFALLFKYFPDHPLWNSKKFEAMLNYINNPNYISGLENNSFGYAYNPPGFEVAFCIQEFSSLYQNFSKSSDAWVNAQLQRSYCRKDKMMARHTKDKLTLAARLYEVTRLEDMDVQLV